MLQGSPCEVTLEVQNYHGHDTLGAARAICSCQRFVKLQRVPQRELVCGTASWTARNSASVTHQQHTTSTAQLAHAAASSNAAQRRESAHRSAAPRSPCGTRVLLLRLAAHLAKRNCLLGPVTVGTPPLTPHARVPRGPHEPRESRPGLTRAWEFKGRRRRAPHGGTAKLQPAAQPRKQRIRTPNLGGPKSPITLNRNLPYPACRILRGPQGPRESGPGPTLWQATDGRF